MTSKARPCQNHKVSEKIPHNTNGFRNFEFQRVRRGRFGWIPLALHQFLIGIDRSERKYAFSTLGNAKISVLSNAVELFAPWLLQYRSKPVQNTKNLHIGSDLPIRDATTQNSDCLLYTSPSPRD